MGQQEENRSTSVREVRSESTRRRRNINTPNRKGKAGKDSIRLTRVIQARECLTHSSRITRGQSVATTKRYMVTEKHESRGAVLLDASLFTAELVPRATVRHGVAGTVATVAPVSDGTTTREADGKPCTDEENELND